MNEIYYKAVAHVQTKHFYSASFCSQWSIKYKLNEWTRPQDPHSKLFVFKTLKNAEDFKAANENKIHIYECKAINPKPISKILGFNANPMGFYLEGIFNEFWKNTTEQFSINSIPESLLVDAPPGTLIADAVKLLRPV
ncbi:MAG: hypothetical protein DWQ19_08990 [Crenarchaeota archaeon]|nr:MAG: hypothetical protein DWQ19_08990 [Thermoproteota archaeon]